MKQDTLHKLIELKSSTNREIYLIEIKGLELLFRPLTFEEYQTTVVLENYIEGPDLNDIILEIAVLHPDNLPNKLPAGTADHLAEAILKASGFEDKDKFIEGLKSARQDADELQAIIEIYICNAYHTISPQDVRNMTLTEQLEYFAKAEEVIGKPLDLEALFPPEGHKLLPDVPPGMESTAALTAPELADVFDFDKMN